MCELLRFGLIRELRLSTNHFHCNTDGSAKLDYDKCILISMESSLNERLASIRSIGDLQFSGCRIFCSECCVVRVFVVNRSCVQRPTAHVHEQQWRHMGQCEERHFYKRTCTYGSDTACQHVDDTVFTTCSFFSSFVTCMRCGLDVSPLIGATATSTNEAFFFLQVSCADRTRCSNLTRNSTRSGSSE